MACELGSSKPPPGLGAEDDEEGDHRRRVAARLAELARPSPCKAPQRAGRQAGPCPHRPRAVREIVEAVRGKVEEAGHLIIVIRYYCYPLCLYYDLCHC